METWFIIIVSLCIATIIKTIISHWRSNNNNLPPGPSLLHSSFLILTNSPSNFKPVLINLKSKYGPIFTLHTGLGPSTFVVSHSFAHQVLVKKSAIFSDRPNIFINFNISTAPYGPIWRLLRRNLASGIMHPSRIKSYSEARKWAVCRLIKSLLEQQGDHEHGVKVVDHVYHAIFRLMVLMCFGEKFDESRVEEIAKVQREMLLIVGSGRFNMLTMFPKVGKILFSSIWKKFEKARDDKERVLVPIIKSRIESLACFETEKVAYVDTLVNLQVNENGGKLNDREMVSMCGEFLTGGTDTTATALQWILANLVKNVHIQRKLYDEIVAVVGPPPAPGLEQEADLELVINEEDLVKMPYLKAVVLEGLRRHPPAHFVLPHRVTKEVEVQGYMFPKGAIINFMVGEMGLDSKVWDEPMEFKPERFLVNDAGDCVFDISGKKGIKMMPFGAGRRICPGLDMAMLHLEYFVANLIWYLDWSVADGYNVDLSEKTEITVVMKDPLIAKVSSRNRARDPTI
ncbi:hypothetical protein QVD17_20808 [Tagetes erecta]|uniref:Cytochrome P450 n=1 Tax=Tagetes erecta TaxID=13708 RepID=A0AAD8KQL8_TARER|nr:hypothetical protein QVD17_20808 [Tagetes erecta]